MEVDGDNQRSPAITDADVFKWKCMARAIPLDASYVPTGGSPLAELSDDALMDMPPQMICHVQRTAAQGGLQVISPRQTPFSALMTRTSRPERDIGDHIVGSIAYNTEGWPLMEKEDLSRLLPDQPISGKAADYALRQKTKTEPLTSSNRVLTDPILSCLVKGRACIDILRRDDVNGGSEELAQLLADAWGMEKEEMDDMDAFTLGVTGSLQRHCIKSDEVYPTVHAPIQIKRCIGVGASQVSKEVLPLDCAMDWRRFRVFCETVFYLAVTTEGIPMHAIAVSPAPGDPTAPGNRRHTMCFVPSPATSWSHAPSTFRINPILASIGKRGGGVPTDVYTALSKYVDVVRPLQKVELNSKTTPARRTNAAGVFDPTGETITSGYTLMSRALLTGSVRGKTSAATARNAIYNAIEAAPLTLRMRLARYMSIANSECKIHLKLDMVPDSVIDKLASKFRPLGEHIRLKIAEECNKRGYTIEQWWSDIMAQTPKRFEEFKEGTAGWTRVGLWLAFRDSTYKWQNLRKAIEYSAIRAAEVSAVGSMSLPPVLGSAARIEAIGRGVVANVSRVYNGYYRGVADVALAIADVMETNKRPTSATNMRNAAYLWELRGRALQGANFYVVAKTEETKSRHHTRFVFPEVDGILAPAPYRAFESYKNHVALSTLPQDFKMHVMNFEDTKQSECFRTYSRPIVPFAESLATRYLTKPTEMADDMEKGWKEICSDIREAVKKYGLAPENKRKGAESNVVPDTVITGVTFDIQTSAYETGERRSYFATLAELTQDQVDLVDMKMASLTEEEEDAIIEKTYASVDELLDVIGGIEDPREKRAKKAREAVN